MKIQIANNALENCSSISQVAELINDEFASDASAELIAATYAIDGAGEAGYGMGEDELSAQLDALEEAGAKFQLAEALEIAMNSVK